MRSCQVALVGLFGLCITAIVSGCDSTAPEVEWPGPIAFREASIEAVVLRGPVGHLNAVWASTDGQAFAVGDHGAIFRFDGNSWAAMSSNALRNLYAIVGHSPAEIYAAGEGIVLRFDGLTWTRLLVDDSPAPRHYVALVADEAGGICAGASGYRGGLFYFDGAQWGQCADPPEVHWRAPAQETGAPLSATATKVWTEPHIAEGIVALCGSGRHDLLAMTHHVTDGSGWMDSHRHNILYHVNCVAWIQRWRETSYFGDYRPMMRGLWVSPDQDIAAVGGTHYLIGRNDVFERRAFPDGFLANDVWGTATDDLIAVGADGRIASYDGRAWSSEESGTSRALRAVDGVPGGDVFAVGEGGTAMHGRWGAWSVQDLCDVDCLNGVWGRSSDDVFAVGASDGGGVVLRYDGQGWQRHHVTEEGALNAIWGMAQGPLYAVGDGGLILRYAGDTWQVVPSPTTLPLLAVHGDGAGAVYAVGYGGLLRGDATAFSSWDTGYQLCHYCGVWCGPSGRVFVVGTKLWGGVCILSFDGETWTLTDAGEEPRAGPLRITGFADDDIYATGWMNSFLHFDGRQWSRIYWPLRPLDGAGWNVAGNDGEQVWFATRADEIIRRGGDHWTRFRASNTDGPVILRGIWLAPDDQLFCVGDGGLTVRYGGMAEVP